MKTGEDGVVRKHQTFFVNKLTGETKWEEPHCLQKQKSILERKKERAIKVPPSLESWLKHVFLAHSEDCRTLTQRQFTHVRSVRMARVVVGAEVGGLALFATGPNFPYLRHLRANNLRAVAQIIKNDLNLQPALTDAEVTFLVDGGADANWDGAVDWHVSRT